MKVIVHFKPIEIEIDEQAFEEYILGDEIAVREVGLEVSDALRNRIPNILSVTGTLP